MQGIVVRDSSLKNGTIRGCGIAVVTSGSLIKKLILDDNALGISLRRIMGSGDNMIIGNIAKNGAPATSPRRAAARS